MKLVKSNPQLNDWIERQKSLNEGLPCKLHEVKALPDACNYYRNKCEFTIGKNLSYDEIYNIYAKEMIILIVFLLGKDELTGESAIGFRLGTYASGSIGIAPIDSLKIIPEIMLKTSKVGIILKCSIHCFYFDFSFLLRKIIVSLTSFNIFPEKKKSQLQEDDIAFRVFRRK